jgi:hypothetical protein
VFVIVGSAGIFVRGGRLGHKLAFTPFKTGFTGGLRTVYVY